MASTSIKHNRINKSKHTIIPTKTTLKSKTIYSTKKLYDFDHSMEEEEMRNKEA